MCKARLGKVRIVEEYFSLSKDIFLCSGGSLGCGEFKIQRGGTSMIGSSGLSGREQPCAQDDQDRPLCIAIHFGLRRRAFFAYHYIVVYFGSFGS